jgi:methylglutaconyl-CoA hydratase
MIAELGEAATALGADHGVRAVVLAGDGASFCAGGDLAWMRAQAEADRATRIESALALARMLRALDEVGKPLVARVHGPAYGGGVGILAVCDIVVAARSARFALTETRLGLIPATIGPYVVRRLGEARTREVVLTARTFDAEEAKALGLVSTVVSDDALDAAVEDTLRPVFATAPGAVAAAKALVRGLGPPIDDAVMRRTVEALADTWETTEAAEGLAAFFDRRKPPWAGG